MASIRSKAVAICVSLLFLLFIHLLPSYPHLDPVLPLPSEMSVPSEMSGRIYRHQGDRSFSFSQSAVSQRDADLVCYWYMFINSPEGSSKRLYAHKELLDRLTDRMYVDESVNLIGKLIFGSEKGIEVLSAVRPAGQPLVDDWACLKSMVKIFETHCGSLSQYGMKHTRSFANICNAGISNETMAKVSAEVCSYIPLTRQSSLRRGFSG